MFQYLLRAATPALSFSIHGVGHGGFSRYLCQVFVYINFFWRATEQGPPMFRPSAWKGYQRASVKPFWVSCDRPSQRGPLVGVPSTGHAEGRSDIPSALSLAGRAGSGSRSRLCLLDGRHWKLRMPFPDVGNRRPSPYRAWERPAPQALPPKIFKRSADSYPKSAAFGPRDRCLIELHAWRSCKGLGTRNHQLENEERHHLRPGRRPTAASLSKLFADCPPATKPQTEHLQSKKMFFF